MRLPDLAFEDADGKPRKLSDWRGKTVLVNLWATWCVPCRKEMPALEGLQTKLGGPNFEVVAINIDTRDPEKPKNFLKEANLTRLGYFSDQKAKVFQDLKQIGRALGMPTSVLVDGQGCEIATIAGPAEWDSDDAIKLIKAVLPPAAGFKSGRHSGAMRSIEPGISRFPDAQFAHLKSGPSDHPGMTGESDYAAILRLPPTPGPTLASEGVCWPAPSNVRTVDFSASRFDFSAEVATCCCIAPAETPEWPLPDSCP